MIILPNEGRLDLYFSGGAHITNSNKRIEGLPIEPECVDVVFEENILVDPPSRKSQILNWAATPLMNMFLTIYLIGLSVASRFGLTDKVVIEILQNSGASVVQTDRNYHRIVATERLYFAIVHWAFAFVSLFGLGTWIKFVTPPISIMFDPLFGVLPNKMAGFTANAILAIEVLLWFLIIGAILGAFFIAATIETRNHSMVIQMEQFVEDNPNASSGCLVVGAAHIPHLKKLVEDSDVIDLGRG